MHYYCTGTSSMESQQALLRECSRGAVAGRCTRLPVILHWPPSQYKSMARRSCPVAVRSSTALPPLTIGKEKEKQQRYTAYTAKDLPQLLQSRAGIQGEELLRIRAVAAVLPFRVNNYVVDELIDWDGGSVRDDPIFRLVFPDAAMLPETDVRRVAGLLRADVPAADVQAAADAIRACLNPHPAGQMELNVPADLPGSQHKYPETLLFMPSQGQTCHSYCTYCFRWAQFVGDASLHMASRDIDGLRRYLRLHPEVTSVLFTGGDPMIMRVPLLQAYVRAVLSIEQIETVRIGTKALAFWPHRFLTDPDAEQVLALFREVRAAGKSVAVQAHFSHGRELGTAAVRAAAEKIQDAGAVIRTQAPLVRGINDSAGAWSDMWRAQLRLGMVPYYMFVERDTGPHDFFKVPLARGCQIFRDAVSSVSGLGRTVRGPSMSATPGKVCVDGVADVAGHKVFVLHMIQARDPSLVNVPFFAHYDPDAAWLTDLKPAFAHRFPFDSQFVDQSPPTALKVGI